MNPITTFDSTKEALSDLLRDVKEGKIQLPDFQRGWVWNDERIRSLLASISLAYPIGVVMLLQTGGKDIRFRSRLVEGLSLSHQAEPERLILDGQQRLTSLFQALISGNPVITYDNRRKPIRRWYYLDINKALDPNVEREEAIISLPEDRKVRNFRGEVIGDYSSLEKECAAELFPLPLVFDVHDLTQWMHTYMQSIPEAMTERMTRWSQLVQEVIQRFQSYQLPLIVLRKDTPKEAVCQVFEKVNTGGVSLTVFELLTATFAADGYQLRQDWEERRTRFASHKVLDGIENSDFLQALTLLASYERQRQVLASGISLDRAPGVSCRRRDILRLELSEYKCWADCLSKGFEAAARLLYSQNIFSARDVPYRTQLVPLAAILAALGSKAEGHGVKSKIIRWFWCGVFGELYGSAVETRFAKDLPEVLAWIEGGLEPDTVQTASFSPMRLMNLSTRNSAAYKGLYALLMRDGGKDFRTGEPIQAATYFAERIDIHHIFPQAWCRKVGIDTKRCNSVVNKTPISAKTNQIIGGNAPSRYLANLQKKEQISDEDMQTILLSHVIDPQYLHGDDFEGFYQAREQSLLDRISQAIGKPITIKSIATVDYDLFDSDWHLLLQSLNQIEGIGIEAGGDIEQDERVIGTYVADVTRNGVLLQLVDQEDPAAELVCQALEEQGARVLMIAKGNVEETVSLILHNLTKPLQDVGKTTPASFHEDCIIKLEKHLRISLNSLSRTTCEAENKSLAVICVVSKQHQVQNHPSYWFSFHPHQQEFLQKYPKGIFLLGCGSDEKLLAIPYHALSKWLDDLWITERDNTFYWLLRVHEEGQKFLLDRKKGQERLDITSFRIPVKEK